MTGVLKAAAASAGATSMGPGLKLAETILQDSELAAGEVVIISDFQANAWTGDEGVAFPGGTAVRTVVLGGDDVDNHAVTQVALNRERVDSRERISPAARIVRTGGDGEAEVEVRLELETRWVLAVVLSVLPLVKHPLNDLMHVIRFSWIRRDNIK